MKSLIALIVVLTFPFWFAAGITAFFDDGRSFDLQELRTCLQTTNTTLHNTNCIERK